MERTIQAPDAEWLTAEQAALWIGIPKETFRALAEAERIPPGKEINRQVIRWHWRTVVAISELLAYLPHNWEGAKGK